MKILHLADLHIGKIIYEQSLLEDQEYMLKQIEKIIEKEKIEAVLISGDIYDRSIPPADAVEVLDKFLNNLIKILKVKVFIISGNHDSKERLNFGSKIFENDGLYIQTTYNGRIRKVELDEKINIYMLPFIKPIEGKISSTFGYRETATGTVPKNHTGTDIAANTGTKIKSATEGEVVLASEEGDYGKHLKIQKV